MGCAFSHTQIFIVDHKQGVHGGSIARGLFLQVKQALSHNPQVHRGGASAALLLASSAKGGSDVVLVGHLKSNGVHCRRRCSSEARFIEQRPKAFAHGRTRSGESVDWAEWRSSRDKGVAESRRSPAGMSRKSSQRAHGNSHWAMTDFSKRLEQLKTHKVVPLEGNFAEEAIGNSDWEREVPKRPWAKHRPREEDHHFEAHIVNHLGAMDGEEGEEEALVWREWDELSAECSSVQIALPQGQGSWHDGQSEASFVLVKKRLKVAWEHHQIVQVRKQSLLRREHQRRASVVPPSDVKMKNNWMPELVQEDSLD